MENISQMSLLEVALEIMEEKGGVVNIYDLIQEVLSRKGIEDVDNKYTTQLYVDITTSSKFVYMGEDNWDLKSRQPLEQFDKDGAAFNPHTADIEEDEDEDEDLSEDDIDEDEEDEDKDSDFDEDEEEEEDTLDEYEPEEDEDSEDDEDSDSSIDEDKYNEYMDDYEDLYEA